MRRVVAALGRTFITAGILILLFVGYQLWGTGIYTSREQDQLARDFETTLSRDGVPAPVTFSGMVGGSIGLYQLNVVIPSVAAGDQTIDLTVDGVPNSQGLSIVIGQ